MNTWHPVTILNSKVDGEEATVCSGAWQRMDWRRAEARQHPMVPAIVGRSYNCGNSSPRLYCIQPDRSALKLEAGERVTPVFIAEWPAVEWHGARGWVWLISDHAVKQPEPKKEIPHESRR